MFKHMPIFANVEKRAFTIVFILLMFSALPVAAFSVNFASASRTAEVGSFTSARTVTALTSVTLAPQVAASSSFFENFNTTENILSLENLVVDTSTGKVMLAKIGEGIFTATQRTTSAYSKEYPQLQVVGDTIHYVWYEDDGSNLQIWTATLAPGYALSGALVSKPFDAGSGLVGWGTISWEGA